MKSRNILLAVLLVGMALFVLAESARCWNCGPRVCFDSRDCFDECGCVKKKPWDVRGRCQVVD